jgi:hypothetical protein
MFFLFIIWNSKVKEIWQVCFISNVLFFNYSLIFFFYFIFLLIHFKKIIFSTIINNWVFCYRCKIFLWSLHNLPVCSCLTLGLSKQRMLCNGSCKSSVVIWLVNRVWRSFLSEIQLLPVRIRKSAGHR